MDISHVIFTHMITLLSHNIYTQCNPDNPDDPDDLIGSYDTTIQLTSLTTPNNPNNLQNPNKNEKLPVRVRALITLVILVWN